MHLTRSISGLLTWQWVVLILALSFNRPLRRLIDRVVSLSLGGKKGLRAEAIPDEMESAAKCSSASGRL
jgi:hypothetical protein